MLKHILISASLLVATAAVAPATASAQQVVGTWETVASYGGAPTSLIDSKDKVFVVAQKNLSVYHKDTHEIATYDQSNSLSDKQVSNIYYNHDKKYLVITYENSNIDLLFDNGRVVNFPEILNAPLTSAKVINDVAFHGDRFYVATDFGLVVMNAKKGIVEQTGIYNSDINTVAVNDDYVFIAINVADANHARGTYVAPRSSTINNWNNFVCCSNGAVNKFVPLNNNKLLGVTSGSFWLGVFNPATMKLSYSQPYTHQKNSLDNEVFQRTKNGYAVHSKTGGTIHTYILSLFDMDGNLEQYIDYKSPAELRNNRVGCYEADPTQIWFGGTTGYGLYNFTDKSWVIDRMVPNGTSGPNVGVIRRGNDGKVFFGSMVIGNNIVYTGTAFIDRLDTNGNYKNAFPNNTNGWYYTMTPDIVTGGDNFIIGRHQDMIVMRDGVATTYNSQTGPWSSTSPMIVEALFDKDQNLWIMTNRSTDALFYVVPRDKWAPGLPAASDFIPINIGEVATELSSSFYIHSSGIIVFSGSHLLGAYDAANTPLNISDDRNVQLPQSVDADGMTITGAYVLNFAEDKNGWLWLASSGGVEVIKDVKKMFEPGFAVSRPKVPRNDGTNLADYLLDNELVLDVSVDANNNKWFATNGSGLYQTNEDGTMILQHFTAENSGLISNYVYSVMADPESNKVYVGTDAGLCIYHSTSAPAAADYSDVYAYPNPVTPDYTGAITITGLMDKSLVKIADSAGNVFYQTISEGGMVTWDGCDPSGARVKSGIYFVLASQNQEGNSGVVTKIMVIN